MTKASRWGRLTGRASFRRNIFGKVILRVESIRRVVNLSIEAGGIVSDVAEWFDAEPFDLADPELRWLRDAMPAFLE